MRTVLYNYQIVDADTCLNGTVVIDDKIITDVISANSFNYAQKIDSLSTGACMVLNGNGLCLTSGFVDMHAHFREPGFSQKETLESASLAAAAGGYTTVCCMANTKPPIDTMEAALTLRTRACELELIDLYPVISITKKMQGNKLSEFLQSVEKQKQITYMPLLLSEDGRDIADKELYRRAMRLASGLNIPLSCHCDLDGEDAATQRVIDIARNTNCRLHIAHVSTKKAAGIVRREKAGIKARGADDLSLTAEATPHHISLNDRLAKKLGAETNGKVAPPLRAGRDRTAIIEALKDGTIDVIATDHAPHTTFDKENGSPGFTGLETSFAVCNKVLAGENNFSLKQLSALMSANPARILGLNDRGKIAKGMRADITIIDLEKTWTVDSYNFKSRGKNTPYNGMLLTGKVLRTISDGKIVY
ncbi:dihydroorotase [Spirochaetia bacterium]|nr:dihydroorotase [Spirochaetia bacterium]